ncbi:MAG: hypothetical protein IJS28_07070 [Synergistaceae bacterium]|nr:hypothetical protein [Synergistaceae bacterium]
MDGYTATPLQKNILQLARYEHNCSGFTDFIRILDNRADRTELYPLIHAADRLIGYLFSYGQQFISIGDRYFQPCLEDYTRYVMFNWRGKEARAFCAGCYMKEWDCKACTFSSKCLRFRTAHAVEHVIASTNSLLEQIIN